jgi:hypothetical protein
MDNVVLPTLLKLQSSCRRGWNRSVRHSQMLPQWSNIEPSHRERFKVSSLIAAVAVIVVHMIASAKAEQAWRSGYGQGMKNYMIQNEAGADFLVVCDEGENPSASFYFNTPKANGTDDDIHDLTLRIDGEDSPFAVTCTQGQCQFQSFSFRTDAQLQDALDRLRLAKSFIVIIPALDVAASFPTRGAAKAIEKNALKHCRN